jgi:asparagine synthase (glutamine-hydrolysing)
LPAATWGNLLERAEPWLPRRLRVRLPADKIAKLAALLPLDGMDAIYRTLVSAWRDPSAVIPGVAEPVTALTDRARWAELDDVTLQMMHLDLVTYLPDDILVKVDRASMGVSLEAREPLLDHRLVEFAWRLPMSMKSRNGVGKWLLRRVLDRYVPRALIERPKMGFGVPIGAWLRGPLREWAEALLSVRRLGTEGFFDPEPIRRRWAEHLAGQCEAQSELWAVLMFQSWLEQARS